MWNWPGIACDTGHRQRGLGKGGREGEMKGGGERRRERRERERGEERKGELAKLFAG